MKKRSLLAVMLALVMILTCFAGCTSRTVSGNALTDGGVLCLRVNPEIAVHYDADGKVTHVEARNDDGSAITADYTGYEGSEVHQVVLDLVAAIGEAGYFLEEIDGERRHITLEIEPGSSLPSETFLTELAEAVQDYVSRSNWTAPVDVRELPANTRTCTNPLCTDDDCDDVICDAGVCTNPYCDEPDCDDADCDDNIPKQHHDDHHHDRDDVRTCTNPLCTDDDCDDVICDAGVCTNPYCDDPDCDDADCDDNIPGHDDD